MEEHHLQGSEQGQSQYQLHLDTVPFSGASQTLKSPWWQEALVT